MGPNHLLPPLVLLALVPVSFSQGSAGGGSGSGGTKAAGGCMSDTVPPSAPERPDAGPGGPAAPKPVPGAPTPARGPAAGSVSPFASAPATWTAWWDVSALEHVDLGDAPWVRAPVAGSAEDYLARDGAGLRSAPATSEWFRAEAVPALQDLLRGGAPDAVERAAVLALARIEEGRGSGASFALVRDRLASPNPDTAAAAAFAVGLLAVDGDVDALLELVNDTPAGRDRVGGPVPERVRAAAAYGLGALAARTTSEITRVVAAQALLRSLADPDLAALDLECAAAEALGLTAVPWEPPFSRAGVVSGRVDVLRALGRGLRGEGALAAALRAPRVRAVALGAIGDLMASGDRFPARDADACEARAELIESLVELARSSSEPASVRRAATLALGDVGGATGTALDALALDTLRRVSRRATSPDLEAASLHALGRLASVADAALAEDARGVLLDALGDSDDRRAAWAALALGGLARDARAAGAPPSPGVLDALRGAFRHRRGPYESGAYALALGLAGDVASTELLSARLADLRGGQDAVRPYIACALGMLGGEAAAPALRGTLEASSQRPVLLAQAAASLASVGDVAFVRALGRQVAAIAASRPPASTARILGRLADARLCAALLETVDGGGSIEARAFAAAVLGEAAARPDAPRSARLVASLRDDVRPGEWCADVPTVGARRTDATGR